MWFEFQISHGLSLSQATYTVNMSDDVIGNMLKVAAEAKWCCCKVPVKQEMTI